MLSRPPPLLLAPPRPLLTPQSLCLAGSKRPLARLPGVGIYLNELLLGVPPCLERFLHLFPALHSITVFLTIRVVPVPTVLPTERLLIRCAVLFAAADAVAALACGGLVPAAPRCRRRQPTAAAPAASPHKPPTGGCALPDSSTWLHGTGIWSR